MRHGKLLSGAVLIAVLSSVLCAGADQLFTDDQIREFYEYDRSVPLNPVVELVETGIHREIWSVVFDDVAGSPVHGQLYLPADLEPGVKHPLILYLHSYEGDRTEMNDMCLYLMGYFNRETKYAIFALDAVYRGERRTRGKDIVTLSPVETRYAIARSIIDYRRAIDYIETRDDIDCSEIHLLGTSMGAMMGGTLGAVEDRIRAATLLVGGGNWCKIVRSSIFGEAMQQKAAFSGHCETMDRFWQFIDPAVNIHMLSPRPLQMHNGYFDFVMPTGGDLFDAAEEPKEIYWYFASHYTIVFFINQVRNRTLDFFDQN